MVGIVFNKQIGIIASFTTKFVFVTNWYIYVIILIILILRYPRQLSGTDQNDCGEWLSGINSQHEYDNDDTNESQDTQSNGEANSDEMDNLYWLKTHDIEIVYGATRPEFG